VVVADELLVVCRGGAAWERGHDEWVYAEWQYSDGAGAGGSLLSLYELERDGHGTAAWENPLSVLMDGLEIQSGTVCGERVTHGAPEWWLVGYGLTNGGQSFEEAAMSDVDGDGANGWEEYGANTDPTNPRSVFQVRVIPPTDRAAYVVNWTGGSDRIYLLYFSTNGGGGWNNLATGLSSSAGSYTDTVNGTTPSTIWYRGGVRVPSSP